MTGRVLPPREIDARGTLHYRDDVRGCLLGRIMGPDLFGQMVTVVEVGFDGSTTTARLLPTRQDDIEAAAPGLPLRTTRFDEAVST